MIDAGASAMVAATKNVASMLANWAKANDAAKQVPGIDFVLSKPYTMIFTARQGQNVAIVSRSSDGITRSMTPLEPIAIVGSWRGD